MTERKPSRWSAVLALADGKPRGLARLKRNGPKLLALLTAWPLPDSPARRALEAELGGDGLRRLHRALQQDPLFRARLHDVLVDLGQPVKAVAGQQRRALTGLRRCFYCKGALPAGRRWPKRGQRACCGKPGCVRKRNREAQQARRAKAHGKA